MWKYTHGITSDIKKQKIEASEVEAFGDYLINVLLTPIFIRQFGSYLRELEDILANGPTPLCVGRTWNQGLTTLGITANYFAQPHLDKKNMGFAFLSWFIKGKRLLIICYSYIIFFSTCSYFIYIFCLVFCRTWRSWTY